MNDIRQFVGCVKQNTRKITPILEYETRSDKKGEICIVRTWLGTIFSPVTLCVLRITRRTVYIRYMRSAA